jgi:hypothetical protein
MRKAKSRLSTKPNKRKKRSNSFDLIKILAKYLNYLPTLVLGGLFAIGLYYLVSTVPPDQIKHFIIPGSYLPFTLGLLLSTWFITSFLLLNSRRGLLISLFLTWLVFLKLQQVMMSPQLVLISLVPFVIVEIFLTLTAPAS